MNKLTSAVAAILILSSASVAFAAPRHVNEQGSVVTRNVALPHNTQSNEAWMDRASQSFDGGGY